MLYNTSLLNLFFFQITLLLGAIAPLTFASTSSIVQENHRSKRAIGKWFSDFFKKFQKKGRRRPMQYHPPPSMYPPASYHPPASNYGTPPMQQYGVPFEPHVPSYLHVSQSNYGGEQTGGYGGGHSSGYDSGHNIPSSGYITVNEESHGHSGGYEEDNKITSVSDEGFGPIKSSDVIDITSGSYQPSPHSGIPPVGAQESNYQDSGGDSGYGKEISLQAGPVITNFVSPPQNAYSNPAPPSVASNSYLPPPIPIGPSYLPPSNEISISNTQYQPPIIPQQPQVIKAPLSSVSTSSENYGPPITLSQPTGLFDIFSGRQPGKNLILNGNTGAEISSPSELGPDDPIIEIVFQDGPPAPAPPPPIIDPSLYEPVKDDVEVYFIEYSPEDELNDFKNLDLSGAEPAILQNLPNELPTELRNHLLQSGVLENAEIEIVDLEQAIHDPTIDFQTRQALQATYNQPRVAISARNAQQAVDVRVKRLNHESNSPEGIAEVLSSLNKFRKGTFAGVVEVNDKGTDKYIPVTVDGDKFPLPKNLPLENKKVDGVLVLAPDARDKRSQTWPSTIVKRGQKQPVPAAIASRTYVPPQKQKRRVDLSWADFDSNGWIPIVNS